MPREALHGEPTHKRQFRLTDTAFNGLKDLASIGGVTVPQLLIAIGSRDPRAYIWVTKYFTDSLDKGKTS